MGPALTLKKIEEMMEPPPFRCPAQCGDDIWHPHFPPALLRRYAEFGGDLRKLGRFCEFPTPEHLRQIEDRAEDVRLAWDRWFFCDDEESS